MIILGRKGSACTVEQSSRESGRKYWAAHSFACSTLLVSLTCSAALIRSLAHSFIPKLVRKCMIRCPKMTWFCPTVAWFPRKGCVRCRALNPYFAYRLDENMMITTMKANENQEAFIALDTQIRVCTDRTT